MNGRIRHYTQDKAGFSLAELMVVIAIIGVLSAIALPSLFGNLPEKRLKNAARNLYADMQRARLQAVQENRKIFVRFETGANGEGGFYYFDTDDNKNFTTGEFRRDLYEYGDVSYGFGKAKKNWDGDDLPGSPISNATFKPTGTVGAGSVFLENKKKDTCYAVTRINYGAVTIRRFNGNNWDEKK